MKRLVAWLFLAGVVWALSFPAPPVTQAIEKDLLGILNLQKAAWNEGNIEGFMDYYWKSEEMTYQSGAYRVRGWHSLLQRYKTNYPGDNRGELDFTDVEVNVLSENSAYVLGRWRLVFHDSTKEGLFTLIFKRLPEGWRIFHDHSS